MMLIPFKSNLSGVTNGAGHADLSEDLSSQPVFIGILVAQSLVFGVAFCRSLFVLLFVLF